MVSIHCLGLSECLQREREKVSRIIFPLMMATAYLPSCDDELITRHDTRSQYMMYFNKGNIL